MSFLLTATKIAISQLAKVIASRAPGTAATGILGAAVAGEVTAANAVGIDGKIYIPIYGEAGIDSGIMGYTAVGVGFLAALGGLAAVAAGVPLAAGVSALAIGVGIVAAAVNPNIQTTAFDIADNVIDFLRDKNLDFQVATSNAYTEIENAIRDVYGLPRITRSLSTGVNSNWVNAKTPPRIDPLAIDLDGDGIETVGIPASGAPILFDHDADGVKTGTGWLKGDDAWLVLDRDGNGTIDSGRELFGVDNVVTVQELNPVTGKVETITRNARTGFEALRSLDTGSGAAGSAGFGDGIFDAKDTGFAQVKLWQDLNQDGISQGNELFTLVQKGIASIGLTENTAASSNLGNGNTVTGTAVVTRTDGTTASNLQASNLNLANNPFYRQFTDAVAASNAAKALPDMGGAGWLRDMREAMSLGPASAQIFTQAMSSFAAGTTRDAQMSQLDALIDAWAKTTGRVDTTRTIRPVARTVVSGTASSQTVRYVAMDPSNYLERNGDFILLKLPP
jgi:hypothetical protein